MQPVKWIIGIDVGGAKKGFHIAALRPGGEAIHSLRKCADVDSVVHCLDRFGPNLLVVVDCPPRCSRSTNKTRLAERQLHGKGFRVQWTRRAVDEPAEWMRNGESLWAALTKLQAVWTIESFPTVAIDWLHGSRVVLPLSLLAAFASSPEWKDFVDAAICAEVGDRYLRDEVQFVGFDPSTQEEDELGRIYF